MTVVVAMLSFTASAWAAGPQLGTDGKTAPVFNYQQATRERVFIPQPGIDTDANGVADKVTIDIIRPHEAGPSLKIPAIIDPSPYYTTVCRGIEGQCMGDFDGDGVNDRWPLFVDNYFVPRGYAYVLAQMNGTGYTADGCPRHGGPTDIAGEKSVIDWLNGRTLGYDAAGNAKVANWHNGSSAMIGKSYDGTLANGVAATGVDGLKTIVPISAISDWYLYSRTGGIRHNTNYPSSLNRSITNAGTSQPPGVNLPSRLPICKPVNDQFDVIDGDETGDRNAFWDERDYTQNVGNVKAAVFATHGFQDDNVRMDQLWAWWNGLKFAGVPRKLWLLRAGHTDPFDSRRGAWVDTLHRWFDHWLYGVDNGIEDEPPVTIEDSKDVWGEYADWPVPGTSDVEAVLRGTSEAAAGTLRGAPGGPVDSVSFTNGGSTLEATIMNAPTGS
jgi:X-Pro dipeptidyl-peptidase